MTTSSSTTYMDNKKHVGILALEVYTPRTFIRQAELEEHMDVAAGKYTIGLGQEGLAVTGDAEDINSLCLTAVHSLLEKYDIDPSQVGRLEVGTETLVDKSKSTKTVLMDLFPGNTDMEGATVVNACYGGTAALLNAFLWCESDGWDGRYAIVVAADIAAYDKGPARPTCGAGAVAVLVGRDAPLTFHPRHRATHAAHVWDFFKPDHTVEYPTVDGALSQVCYYQALEDVYERFCQKMTQDDELLFDATTPDYLVFHSPYNKLVQKSYARLFLLDARRRRQKLEQQAVVVGPANEEEDDTEEKKSDPPLEAETTASSHMNTTSTATSNAQKKMMIPEYDQLLEEWLTKPIEETYNDKNLEKVLKNISKPFLAEKMGDANFASIQVGNTYTASVFLGLASLVDRVDLKPDQSIVVFSYGSGALATMYGLTAREPVTQHKFTVKRIKMALDLTNRLAQREKIHPAELDRALDTRAHMHHAGAPYTPVYPTEGRLYPGTYYLVGIDENWRRTYARVPLDAPLVETGIGLAPPSVLELEDLETAPEAEGRRGGENDSRAPPDASTACLITGTAAGLPGREQVFRSDNIDRLLAGEQCIQPVSDVVKKAMLDKNIVQQRRHPNKTTERISLDKESDMIQLSAQLGTFDMTKSYGVPEGLAKTMDLAAQVAVAAGMEALKNAGLVSGKSNDPSEWKLPEQYRDSTGVVYASSFPAMDAAIGEVIRCLSSRTLGAADTMRLVASLRSRLVQASPERELSDEDEAAFVRLLVRAQEVDKAAVKSRHYEFDRKFLFRVLVLGNAQLAQLAGCRGPNTQTNAACAGTTQAIAMAQDMLVSGRAKRVVVIAGDNASGDTLMPWLGTGFHVLGAATTKSSVEEAALPFDKRRSGMLLGAGGIGLVLETEESAAERQQASLSSSFKPKARLLATQYSNSAYHGAALDRYHIGRELVRFLADIETRYGISKAEIAEHGVYFSHETCTHASDVSSCAGNEVAALRHAFGDDLLAKLLILNTKGFTGHPMGVSFEDIAAVEVLNHQIVPAVPNHKVHDDYLGKLNLSKGGPYSCRYALRFAAGFGSQVAFALYATL